MGLFCKKLKKYLYVIFISLSPRKARTHHTPSSPPLPSSPPKNVLLPHLPPPLPDREHVRVSRHAHQHRAGSRALCRRWRRHRARRHPDPRGSVGHPARRHPECRRQPPERRHPECRRQPPERRWCGSSRGGNNV